MTRKERRYLRDMLASQDLRLGKLLYDHNIDSAQGFKFPYTEIPALWSLSLVKIEKNGHWVGGFT